VQAALVRLCLALLFLSTGPAWAAAADSALEKGLAAEVEQFVASDKKQPPASCQVLFVGSSSIRKWTTLAHDMAPLPVINRGFGGSHIEYVNRWFDQIVAPYKPRAIVFYAGENDLDAGKSVARIVADFDAFMARKSAVLGPTPVYFVSVKPSELRFEQFAQQTELNTLIRRRAGERDDLEYIDLVSPMLERGKPKNIFEKDRLHMTPAGYAIWTRVIKSALLPQAEAQERTCTQRANSASY
jgi:hypothetical protein